MGSSFQRNGGCGGQTSACIKLSYMQYINLLLYLIIPFSELTVIPLFSFLFHIFAVIGSSAVFLLELKHVGKCKIYFANIHYQCFSFFFSTFP